MLNHIEKVQKKEHETPPKRKLINQQVIGFAE